MSSKDTENVTVNYEHGEIIIRLNPKNRLGHSASGKTVTVASTRGFVPVHMIGEQTVYVSLNAFVYPPRS